MGTPLQSLAIASANNDELTQLQQLAENSGYACVGLARTAIEAVALVQMFKPQVLLLDLAMPGLSGLEGIRQLLKTRTTALALMTREPDEALCRQALDLGAEAVITLPWAAAQTRAILQTAWRGFERDQNRQTDIETLKDALETRKLVDRAKGILMVERGISEPEAYRLLQKMSQDKRVSMKDVCRAVDHIRSIVGTPKKSKTTP